MSWSARIIDKAQAGKELPKQVSSLLRQQRMSWKMLRDGEAALGKIKSKTLVQNGEQIVVQENPGRRISTNAKVDPLSIARRPCFLCLENLPLEERGIELDEFVIFPNPYPILQDHLTIPIREHLPQRLENSADRMLEIASLLGSEMLVYYNGARCGASAPDHFHFQAGRKKGVPLFERPFFDVEKNGVTSHSSFGRRMLACCEKEPEKVASFLHQALELLAENSGDAEEALVNILCAFQNGRYIAVLFPRGKHRPECYFSEVDSRLAISPAALEMAGILVVAEPEHFERVNRQAAVSIYKEVTLNEKLFTKLTRTLC